LRGIGEVAKHKYSPHRSLTLVKQSRPERRQKFFDVRLNRQLVAIGLAACVTMWTDLALSIQIALSG
jgi:hypothetical protein